MAIRNLTIAPCNTPQKGQPYCIEDTVPSLVVGNIYAMSAATDITRFNTGCYIILNELDNICGSDPNVVVFSPAFTPEQCEDCVASISNAIILITCISNFKGNIIISIDDITPTPSIGDVFNITSAYIDVDTGQQLILTTCYNVQGFGVFDDPNKLIPIISYSASTDCETCLQDNGIIYDVKECLNNNIYYISFPSNTFENHLVTFTGLDGITQYCGTVGQQSQTIITTGLLVNDLGLIDKFNNNCDTCLETVADKKKLVNCLTGDEAIVWASSLFTVGDSTNLSYDNGCWEVSPDFVDPSTPVDIIELANFDPHPNCESCLECHGATYYYSSCTEVEVCGSNNLIPYNTFSNGREIWIDSNDVATVSFGTGNIAKYDLNTQSFINVVFLGINPWGVAVDEINNVICVGDANSNELRFIDNTNISNYTGVTTTNNSARKVYSDSGLFYITFNSSGLVPNIQVWSASPYNNPILITSFGKNFEGYYDIVRIGSKIYAANYNVYGIDVFDSTTYAYEGTLSTIGFEPLSFDYDGLNSLYVTLNTNSYAVIDITTSATTIQSYSTTCNSGTRRIKVNNLSNKFYITDNGCTTIHEFDLLTGLLITEYNSTNLSDFQPLGIGVDSSGNTWFVAYNNLFQVSCNLEYIEEVINSYEYIPIGNTFYDPIKNVCAEVTSIDTSFNGSNDFYSVLSYSGCSECTGQTFDLFYCVECSDSLYTGLLVAPTGQYTIGDFVKSHWGNSNWFCFEILDNWTINTYGTPNVIFDGESIPSYSSCTDCQGVATIGITVINCDTLVESQVTLTFEQWAQVEGVFGFSYPVISDTNGNCYTVVNSCPIDNIYPAFQLSNYYFNSTQCRASNRPTPPFPDPISAGTEYLVCVECSGSTFTITPPHPVWTGPYGNAITLLDAIVLGGPNGLNS
jgi:hypothetical protein